MSSTTDWVSDQDARESDAGNSAKSDSSLRRAKSDFVEWAPDIDGPHRPKIHPRLYHKKSRTGCTQCKARRVKV